IPPGVHTGIQGARASDRRTSATSDSSTFREPRGRLRSVDILIGYRRSTGQDGIAVMKLIAVDDIQLRCEHLPNPGAPALLLLNSLGTSLEMWDEQIDALRERYEIVRFDARGHGRSGATARTELSIGDLA